MLFLKIKPCMCPTLYEIIKSVDGSLQMFANKNLLTYSSMSKLKDNVTKCSDNTLTKNNYLFINS